jgi:type II secretory pathway predicted ATPase ExeA
MEHFGFQKEPFARDIPVEELVRFGAHRELIARLQYAAEHRQPALITGDTGAGKTTAVRATMKRLDDSRYRFMYIASRGLSPKTLYRELLDRMQIQPRFRLLENQTLVHQAFEESHERGQEWVLIIDECHELDVHTLTEFRFVLNHRTDSYSPISLWLVGQTELRDKLRLRVLASLAQRIPIRYHMAGLTEPEVAGYIGGQLTRVGREASLFHEEAVQGVAKWSQGNPRMIGTLCRAALIDAAARKNSHVEYEHVERAWNEVNNT